jgi:hypothetical protein
MPSRLMIVVVVARHCPSCEKPRNVRAIEALRAPAGRRR